MTWLRRHRRWSVWQGDCLALLETLSPESVDLIFADPPYFLSGGGVTCQSGKMVSVNKGSWDVSKGIDSDHAFNLAWLGKCKEVLKPDGTIFVSGTRHIIFSIGFAMQTLGFRLLNEIIWNKPNPPPNLCCRYFTHSTETILWAARDKHSRWYFDYKAMKQENGGKQMKSVWTMLAPPKAEKAFGKHPTQKPLSLLTRIVQAASLPGDLVVDPFAGSGTTGVACTSKGRRFIGIELDLAYCNLARTRITNGPP